MLSFRLQVCVYDYFLETVCFSADLLHTKLWHARVFFPVDNLALRFLLNVSLLL